MVVHARSARHMQARGKSLAQRAFIEQVHWRWQQPGSLLHELSASCACLNRYFDACSLPQTNFVAFGAGESGHTVQPAGASSALHWEHVGMQPAVLHKTLILISAKDMEGGRPHVYRNRTACLQLLTCAIFAPNFICPQWLAIADMIVKPRRQQSRGSAKRNLSKAISCCRYCTASSPKLQPLPEVQQLKLVLVLPVT